MRKNAKLTKGKTNSQKTAGFRNQMHIGMRIAAELPEKMGRPECAKLLGLSTEMVRRIEYLALFKVQARMIDFRNQEI